MSSILDSQSNLLKMNTDQITTDQPKDCSFCNKSIKIGEIVKYERKYCKTSLKSASYENNKKVYYSLVLVEKKVNIYRLKSFITKNQSFLRQIIIQHCQFYLSDGDLDNNLSVGPLRMLQEIDFNYMFEMFSFQDISILEIDVCNTDLLKGTSYFIGLNDNNSKIRTIKLKTSKVLSVEENNESLTKEQQLIIYQINTQMQLKLHFKNIVQINIQKREFLNEFNCDKNCKMMEYEYGNEKQEMYEKMIKNKKESEEIMIRKLKFGDCLEKEKFGQLLVQNFLSEIKYHLETYKMYTKYAFYAGQLLILGDVLKNPFSLLQLQNLIQINLQLINTIIFKDNQSIPQRVFSQLMKYFLEVPSLKIISFISSVLSQDNLNDLLYLIKQKQVDYLVLHKSYFLKEEINQIIKINEEDFVLNHLRYYIFEIQFDQIYEFTPYSFSYDLLKSKQNCDLLDVEAVYLEQYNYPKKIKNVISFFQGKNLSILHNNESSKILLQIGHVKKLNLTEKELEKLLELLIQTDDMNFIVFQTFNYGMEQLKNDQVKNQLQSKLLKKKSYLSTIQIFSDLQIKIKNFGLWQLFGLSFLSGFLKTKQKDIQSFIFKSIQISNFRGQKSLKTNKFIDISNLDYQQSDENIDFKYIQDLLDRLESQIEFSLYLDSKNKSHKFEKSILQNCKNFGSLFLQTSSTNERIDVMQFENICSQIEQLHFQKVQAQLCQEILGKCTRLKKLIFYFIDFNFKSFNEKDQFFQTIEELIFLYCEFSNQLFLNQFLQSFTQLRVLNIKSCTFENKSLNIQNIQTSIQVLNLPPSLTSQNYQDYYIYILNNLKNLKELVLYHNNDNCEQNQVNLQLNENIPSLKKIVFTCLNTKNVLFLKYLLKSSPNLAIIELIICNQQDCKIDFEQLQLLDLSKIKQLSIEFKILNYESTFDQQNLSIIQLFKNLEKLKLEGITFTKDINKISKKLTKIQFYSCKFFTTQFIQLILEDCQDIQSLRLNRNQVFLNENDKLDFTKMRIKNLQKLQFYFSEEFFNFDFISNLLAKQNNIKQIKIDIYEFKLDANRFINLIKDKNNLVELIIYDNFHSSNLDSDDISNLIEKIGDFFDITNFNQKHTWNEEILKNKEINFFNVLDSQNITIYSQLRKQFEFFEDKHIFLNKEQKVNVMNNTNFQLNKYCNYPPVNFYDTFNVINKFNNESYVNQQELNKMLNELPIYINPFQDQTYQNLQILELINIKNIKHKNLINFLQKQLQTIDIIFINLEFNNDSKDLILNDFLFRNLSLRKLIIQRCEGISHLFFNILIQNQQLEQLKIEAMFFDQLDFNLISPKLQILQIFQSVYKLLNINILENIFERCKQLQLISIKGSMKIDNTFENIHSNLKYLIIHINLNAEQINQIINKCKQLEVLEINLQNDNDYNKINFDKLSLCIKKLATKNNSIISSIFENPLLDYLFFKKIPNTNYEKKAELNFLLSNFEQNSNDIYIDFTPQLTKLPKFIKYIEQRNIINLRLSNFEDDLKSFFQTVEKQLQNLKHLTLEDCDYNQILYENNNIFEFKNIETINIIQKDKIFKQVKERNLNFNIFKNIKQLSIILSKDSVFQLSQVLENCTSLEIILFQLDEKTNIDFSAIHLPKQTKIIKIVRNNKLTNQIISSKQMKQCDQLKCIDIYNSGEEKLDLKNISKSLEKLNIRNGFSLDDIQSIQNLISSSQQNLKILSCDIKNNKHLFKGIVNLSDKIKQIKCKQSFEIYHRFQQDYASYYAFPHILDHLQDLKLKHRDSNYELAINLFGNFFENVNRDLTIQYLYLSLFSDFIESQSISQTFLIYSPYTIFQKNKNPLIQKQNEYKEDTLSMIDQFNFLKDYKQYIFGFDREYFNQYYNFYENILSQGSSKVESLIHLSQKLEYLNYNNAYIPYECIIDQETLNKYKINEYDFLLIISIIPPIKLEIKEMSISFIKSWYSINYYAPLTTETVIHEYNESLIENSSISNLILLYAYEHILNLNKNSSDKLYVKILNQIKLMVLTLLYTIFNQLNSEPRMFKFDHSVIHLEVEFTKIFKAKYHYLIRFLYIFYLFVCTFGIWYFSFDSTQSCGVSLSKYSYVMYFSFGLITFIVEALLFKMCLNFVSHLIPQMKPDCGIGFPKAQINQIKKFMIDIPWFNQQYVNYSITFIISQLSRFDFFTNIGFILTTYLCENYILFYCSLVSIGSITLINFFIFFIQKNIFGNKEKNKLMTGHIDVFYQICNLLSFLSVADILDIISPSNCVVIKGKMYNQKIIGHFFKIIIQDIPFIVLQALQLISESQINQSVTLSIVLSIIMFIVSLIKFISLTPTTISQKEFDILNVIKKEKIKPEYQNLLSDFESQIYRYNLYEQLKCLKSKNYFMKCLKKNLSNQSLNEEEKKQMRLIERLRECNVNQKSIEEMFGNKEFN